MKCNVKYIYERMNMVLAPAGNSITIVSCWDSAEKAELSKLICYTTSLHHFFPSITMWYSSPPEETCHICCEKCNCYEGWHIHFKCALYFETLWIYKDYCQRLKKWYHKFTLFFLLHWWCRILAKLSIKASLGDSINFTEAIKTGQEKMQKHFKMWLWKHCSLWAWEARLCRMTILYSLLR